MKADTLTDAKALKYLVNRANEYGSEIDLPNEIVEAIKNHHNTVQQVFVGIVLTGLIRWAEDCIETGCFDGRNEASIRTLIGIKKHLDEEGLYWQGSIKFPYI